MPEGATDPPNPSNPTNPTRPKSATPKVVAFVWERTKLYSAGEKVGYGDKKFQCLKGHRGDWITEPEIGLYWQSYWKPVV